ncbi:MULTISPECIES: hypothetical protein [unclassified Rhizobacter]|uniref:hypothetical protein n=1 Tax=unclassified Rhizobacter TaxID=2640088 RepID=UPI0006FE2926|nr:MULTISPECIES: hypothetical protein [unclassified Rhizobacter]KQU73408.1 hypothetical protein ASC88_04125 [Rhizobacter sp. Root29]KQV98593.1 hypothetical protein ASC98_07955 [Rhizobacter sp. Root1238]KRB04846.1 hypothetical protein ASE08_13110 [Rhizobacter sp. Root16D2]
MRPLLILAVAALATQGAAFAAATGRETAPDAAWAERMRLIGRTPEPGEQAVPLPPDTLAQSAAERRQDYVERMALIGRTPGPAEVAAATTAPGHPMLAAAPSFDERMKLIGRSPWSQ